MKKIFRKNQVIITALALMIAVAGYISYTQSNDSDKDVVKTKTDQTASANTTYDISDEDLAADVFTDTEDNSKSDAKDTKTDDKDTKTDDTKDTKETSSDSTKTDSKSENPGETVLTNADAKSVDFASEMKLNREQMRSKNKEDLMEIINNNSITEAQKQNAIDKMVEMTNIAERENAAEILLEAKGFTDVVVSITDDGADVVLNMGDVTDAKRAQIEDIMKRKTGVSAENIVITPISE
ncbi:Stage III sporulation protein AH [uncultured Roseburia sp.]|uniref:SpoIIIAH-like family protein n=1 Tax=Brotonthovivens ammoniilytica TaxID=2981725 RepID=A0ABT2TFK7_9FIRM|nr:SpoIIIAH-like family protein [Brotonthovivens ammoniilytica]MCU6760975.1 SpoIIIAH-like family protein [Brotonthovivens ammoniilytica]SCI15111.1 Stage III sporulation protein AH [uncultured Roseburia sp.]